MTHTPLKYLGPLPSEEARSPTFNERVRNVPWAFIAIVVFPTLIVFIYYVLIATPRYVSEAEFIVRETNNRQPTALGLVLQGAGLSSAQGDAFAVHQYMVSRDALREINKDGLVTQALNSPKADLLSRRPRLGAGNSFEELYKGFTDYLTVGYDSRTGISVIRVQAFDAREAQRINTALLEGGEALVNRLNDRASADAVAQASRTVEEARERVQKAQAAIADFRNRERFLDPESAARESGSLIAGLSETLSALRAEKAQLTATAPESPQMAALDQRIAAYEVQLSQERRKLVGDTTSLAPKIGAYETLALERQLAGQALTAANVSLDTARQDARRQRLYLDRIVNPNLPDKPSKPNRLKSVLTVLLSTLVIYGLGWLLVAGVREHQQN
ncbi:capsular polysaccharide transport system permease protein [Brevundimonas vesicularis]|uniref:chain-length determining protein n=1 Tax=Brevundimonas vesicularis TaxID=41276 RepID=UPI0027819E7B|nr:chain-length determining protein [Brevundimonas vesicularis]MDQ1194132.1 capsular polysaccharide transport system permease protein [Brevundimonas vesicularis]